MTKKDITKKYTKVDKSKEANDLIVNEYLTYHIILKHRMNCNGKAYCGYRTLAKLVGISKDNVGVVIQSLLEKGWINIELEESKYKTVKFLYTFPKYDEISKFEKVPTSLLETKELSKNAKYFMVKIFQHTLKDYSYKYTQKELANLMNLSLDQIKKILKELKTKNFIEARRKSVDKKVLRYTFLNMAKLYEVAEAENKKKDQRILKLETKLYEAGLEID